MAALFAAPAHAIEWRVEPSLGASATYSDNANQSENDPQDQLSLSVTPGVTLRSEGSRRLQATLQYFMNGVARFGDDESQDLYHNLNATAKAELAEDFLFLDASARVSQELISLLGSPADVGVNDSNRATQGSYSISPYIQRRFGSFAELNARYTLSGVLFSDNASSDLLTNTFAASLNSGTRFDDLSWGLAYSLRNVSDRDTGVDDTSYTYERADLSLGYALTRKFRLIGNVGHEWLEYDDPLAAANNRDDSLWSAGFAWAPSRRSSIEATAGERFFGNTYSLSAQHRTRVSVWSASYVEDVNDISQVTLVEGTVYLYLCDGNFVLTPFPIPPEPGCVLVGSTPGLIPSLANGLYVGKTMRAGVSWGIRKVTYSVNAFDVRRAYLLQNDAEDRSSGLSGTVNYRMDALTNLFANLSYTRNEDPAALNNLGFDREDDLYSLGVGVNHRFAEDLTGALTYRHYRRDSNDPTAEYSENNITASVNMRF
jgi:uncharacterized protein (PEP-CTERM system associated)